MDLEQEAKVTIDTSLTSDIAKECNKLLELQNEIADKKEEKSPTDNSGVKMTGHFCVEIDFAPSLEMAFSALNSPMILALSVFSKFLLVE